MTEGKLDLAGARPPSSAPTATAPNASAPKAGVAAPEESAPTQMQSTDWMPYLVGAGVAALVVLVGGVALINYARETPAQQAQDAGNCAGACAGTVLDNCLNAAINGCANAVCGGVTGAAGICCAGVNVAPQAMRALSEAPPPSTSTGAMPY